MGRLQKALAGFGGAAANVGLMQLQSDVNEMRAKKLAMFEAELNAPAAEAKYQRERADRYAEIETENAYESNRLAQAHEYNKELEGIKGQSKSSRVMSLASKISKGKASEQEQKEYYLLINADPLTQLKMRMMGSMDTDSESPLSQEELDRARTTLNTAGGGDKSNDWIPFNEPGDEEIRSMAYQSRKRGGESSTGGTSQGNEQNPYTPMSDTDFNAIPSGSIFRDPDDGRLYRKP